MNKRAQTLRGAYAIIGVIVNMIALFHWHFWPVRDLAALGNYGALNDRGKRCGDEAEHAAGGLTGVSLCPLLV